MNNCSKKKGKPVTKVNPEVDNVESPNVTPTSEVDSTTRHNIREALMKSGSELMGDITANHSAVSYPEFQQRLTHWLNEFNRIGEVLLGSTVYTHLLTYQSLFNGILIGVNNPTLEEKSAEDPPDEYRTRAYDMCNKFTTLCEELRNANNFTECLRIKPRVQEWCADFTEYTPELHRTELWPTLQRNFSAFDGWLECSKHLPQPGGELEELTAVDEVALNFVSDMEQEFVELTDRFTDITDDNSFKALCGDIGEWTCRFGANKDQLVGVPGYESLEAHYNYLLGWRFATTQFKGSWEYPEGSCIPQLNGDTLGAKVVELTEVIEKLTMEKQTLMEEVECYRKGMDSFKSDIKLADAKHNLGKEAIKLLYTLYCSEG